MVKTLFKKFGTMRAGMPPLMMLFAFFLSSCMDDDAAQYQPTPVGYVSIYQASPDAPALDISVDNRVINNRPFGYSDYSGYLNFFTGDRNLKVSTANAASALVDTTLNVADGKAYAIFVINTLANGLETLIVADSSGLPAAGKAMVRFINLSPDAPAVDLKTTGTNASSFFENNAFKTANQFKEVNSGIYDFAVNKSGTDEKLVSANRVALRAGGYYTIITRGFVNPPSNNANVLSLEVL